MSGDCLWSMCRKEAVGGWYCREHKEYMDKQNDWETIISTPLVWAPGDRQILEFECKPGYDYEIRRRKKVPEMPELIRGDGIETRWSSGVYMGTVEYDTKHSVNTISGVNHKYRPEEILSVMRGGQQIWRRE